MMSKHEFARAVDCWADGNRIEFRVKPNKTKYGSTNDWHAMDNPWFDNNFEYRVLDEVEKLNMMAAIYEGDD